MQKILTILEAFLTFLGNMVIFPLEKLFQFVKQTRKERNKVALVSSILILVLAPIFILSLMNARSVKSAWYDNSWNQRKPVTITYSGSTLTDYDVLIEIDTATLITAGKMQADCDDIRVTDANETTLIDYWVEGGCNTSTTQVWATVPSIPNGGKDIYIYYNNSGATNSEESWSGSFTLLGDASCPSGWTRNSDLDAAFPQGASSYGATGGSTNSTHSNTTGSTNTTGTGSVKQGTRGSTQSHNHSVNIPISANSALPPYLDMIYCSSSDLTVDTGQIALFDASAPSGWTRFSALDGVFPRGAASYGGTGGSSTHTHSTSASTSGGPSSYGACTGGSTNKTTSNHTHSISSTTTSSANHTPPYLDMVFAERDAQGSFPAGGILITNSLPPLGWTRFSALDSSFARGASSYGGTGGASTHSHSFSVAASASPANNGGCRSGTPNIGLSAYNHGHNSKAYNTPSGSSLPPYVDVIYAERDTPVATTALGSEEVNNTPPNTPSLDSPSDTATNQSLLPQLKTTTTDVESDYLRYKIEICTNVGMTAGCQTFDQTSSQTGWSGQNTQTSTAYTSGTQATYTIQSVLTTATTYYWRSYANDPAGSSVWSSTQGTPYSFATTTAPDAPTTPFTEGQVNPLHAADATPEFSAIHTDDDGDAANYFEIEVNTQSDFGGTVMWDSTKTAMNSTANGARSQDISYAGSSLALDDTTPYYWRIRFWDTNEAVSDWSATQSFIVIYGMKPATACVIDETADDSQLTISWTDNAIAEDGYELQRSVNAGAFSLFQDLAADSTSHVDSTISQSNSYRYRVAPYETGPTYGDWCYTGVLDLGVGSMTFEGVILN